MLYRKTIYIVANWAEILVNQFNLIDQSISKIIISNYNFKFLFDLWIALHEWLDVKFFYLIAYYPQINRVNKYINQTAKIALRFDLHTIENLKNN